MNGNAWTSSPHSDDVTSTMNGDKVMNGKQVVPPKNDLQNGPVPDEKGIGKLLDTVIDELCALRCDIDVLKKGSWRPGVIPHMSRTTITDTDHEKYRADIAERVQSKINQAPLVVLSHTTNNGLKKVPQVNGASISSTPNGFNIAVQQSATDSWKSAYISSLKPASNCEFPTANGMVAFSWDFLQRIFQGAIEHSPGLWYVPRSAGGSLLDDRTLFAIDNTNEPYLPAAPCDHGAKLTAFFNEDSPADGETASENVPLFVSASAWGSKTRRSNEYIYYGNYSQTRWSDKLGYDDLHNHIPKHVKEFHAAQLADPSRPAWVTKALMKHFFPMPEYEGVMPVTTPNGSAAPDDDQNEKALRKLRKCVEDYIEDLRLWESEAKNMVGLMKKDDILKAFEKADADTNPGLRLWWEYLECKSWDQEFYDMLVQEQAKFCQRR